MDGSSVHRFTTIAAGDMRLFQGEAMPAYLVISAW